MEWYVFYSGFGRHATQGFSGSMVELQHPIFVKVGGGDDNEAFAAN